MAQYQAAIIPRPLDWKPACPDDVPLELDGPVAVLGQWDDIFEAVARAIEHNESDEARRRGALGGCGRTREPGPNLACRPTLHAR